MSTQSISAPVVYKEIRDFPGYRVGDDGSVWSQRRIGRKAGLTGEWRQLRAITHERFYLKVTLHNRDVKLQRLVHLLVLEAFIGPCPDGMEGCHNDGAQAGHHLANLRWDTPKNNHADKRKHGTILTGSRHGRSKLTEAQVKQFREHIASFTDFHERRTAVAAARKKLGISQAMSSLILNRKNWTHI